MEEVSERALFVIGRAGIIRWSYVSPVGLNPGTEGFLSELPTLTNEEGTK